MLAGLRSAAKSKLAIPIIGLLAISFAVWGVNDAFTGGARGAVATVGPEKVTIQNFSQAFRTQVQTLSQETGQAITTAEARQAGLEQQILSQMITQAALDAKAGELRLAGSDLAVSQNIMTTEAFRDSVRGEFSRDVYAAAIANISMRPSEYEDAVRRDISRLQLVNAVIPPARAPQQFVAARQTYQNEVRTAELLILPAALAPAPEAPGDAALQAIIDENPAAFTFPEMRAITVAWLDMTTMQAIVNVSDEDVQALYDFRRDSLAEPATRSFVQLTAPDEATANAVAERLRAGEAAADIAANLGLADPFVRDAAAQADIVDSAIAAQVFESPEPRVIVVEGSLGWAAVQISGGTEAREPSFDEVVETLRAELAEDSAIDTLYEAVANLEDARGAGLTLEDAAVQAGVASHSYPPVSAQARGQDGDFYIDLAQAPVVLQQAFTLAESATSGVIELPDGGFAMVRVDSIVPQRVASLEEARDDAESLWRARTLEEGLREIEAAARAQIDAGASFTDAAGTIGQPARTEVAIIRRGQTAGPVDAQLSAALFGAERGQIISGRTAGDSRVLARVTAIEHPEGTDLSIANEMRDELTNDLLTQFQNALSAEYEVRVYEDQIDLALGDTPQ